AHRKTQTPIVAKQPRKGKYTCTILEGICIFTKFKKCGTTKEYKYPLVNILAFLIFRLFGPSILSQKLVFVKQYEEIII
ncbi:MAG: hypothetical protein J6B09_03390, partial [Clostridia bacterium]|nr:hypothetical protein [Clostridia bacterium]